MSQTLSQDLRSRVIAAVDGGMSRNAAARHFGIGISTAIRWVREWRTTGVATAKPKEGPLPAASSDRERVRPFEGLASHRNPLRSMRTRPLSSDLHRCHRHILVAEMSREPSCMVLQRGGTHNYYALRDELWARFFTIVAGRQPRRSIMPSSSRPTRNPYSNLLATRPRHSWVKSSTAASTRNRRPLASASDTKFSDQRWLAAYGNAISDRVPNACFRSPRLRTPSRSSW